MYNITVGKTLNAPRDDVWASWADFGNIAAWHPFVSDSKLLGDPAEPVQLGSQRQCDLADGKNFVRERIVEFRRPERLKIEMYDGTLPMKSVVATVSFGAPDADRTRVVMAMDFEPKYGLLGKLMVPMIKRQFRQMFTELLEANERNALERRGGRTAGADEAARSASPMPAA